MRTSRVYVALAVVLVLAACSSVSRRPIPKEGLLAHFTFDSNENGAIGKDASGKDHHATVDGQAVSEAGRIGGALKCSGLSTFMLPAGAFANPSAQITLAAWIKPTVSQYSPVLEFSADAFHYGPHLWVTQQGGIYMNFWGSPGNDRVVQTAPGVVPAAAWTHVACTYDGSKALVYVNGQAAGAEQWPGLKLEVGYPFYVGARKGWGHGNAVFGGSVDEVVVYDRALSADELRQLATP